MNNSNEIRWLQRFENFSQALPELTQACSLNHYDNLQRAGLVKTFEFCLGLSWNVLKDLLSYEGYDVKVPREVIRKAFEAGYINEDD